jgi:hypothetical protein
MCIYSILEHFIYILQHDAIPIVADEKGVAVFLKYPDLGLDYRNFKIHCRPDDAKNLKTIRKTLESRRIMFIETAHIKKH